MMGLRSCRDVLSGCNRQILIFLGTARDIYMLGFNIVSLTNILNWGSGVISSGKATRGAGEH